MLDIGTFNLIGTGEKKKYLRFHIVIEDTGSNMDNERRFLVEVGRTLETYFETRAMRSC
jgi:hypothetical protein